MASASLSSSLSSCRIGSLGAHCSQLSGQCTQKVDFSSKRASKQKAFAVRADSGEPQDDVSESWRAKYSGFVQSDTAGQQNIYSVEPTVYIAESAISTGTAGESSDGSGGTLLISGFLGLAAVGGAAAVLFSIGSTGPAVVPDTPYDGPSLTYYVQKFEGELAASKVVVVEAAVAPEVSDVVVFVEAEPVFSSDESKTDVEAIVLEAEGIPDVAAPGLASGSEGDVAVPEPESLSEAEGVPEVVFEAASE